jgi:uncharacterized small protein (DUF1192 family)
MNAKGQPDYSKLPNQFKYGVEKGKTKNLFENSGDLIDGRKQIAHLIDTVILLNSSLIEEVEERTRLQKRNQTCEECIVEFAELNARMLERIAELKQENEQLKAQLKKKQDE